MRLQTEKITFLGLMLAIVLVLSTVEHMVPPLPLVPPNVKLGLSNIVTMYVLFYMSKKAGMMLNVLKSFFVFLMRGPIAGLLSFCGGILSIAVIIVLLVLFREKISYVMMSVSGAIAHNLGQFAVISIMLGPVYILLPILVGSGILMGTITGVLLKVLLPVFQKIGHHDIRGGPASS